MPQYTLRCPRCGLESEKFAWGDLAAAERVCPQCPSEEMRVLWMEYYGWEDLAAIGCA